MESADANGYNISIHAPTRGATIASISAPTALDISIHAPTRGATCSVDLSVVSAVFQSTLPRGERQDKYFQLIEPKKFQSTLPRGERRQGTDGTL